MKYINKAVILFILMVFIFGCSLFNPDKYNNDGDADGVLFINEFLASNSTNLADEFGEFDDWVEIYNISSDALDIGGMYVADDLADSTPYRIPDTEPSLTTIEPGEFLILWFDRDSEQGILHVEHRLARAGEAVVLIGKDGETILDSYEFGPQDTDVSAGRDPDGSDNWITFQIPTPGISNNEEL